MVEGKIEEIEQTLANHAQVIGAIQDQAQGRHEDNLQRFATIGERIAALPELIGNKVELIMDRRLGKG